VLYLLMDARHIFALLLTQAAGVACRGLNQGYEQDWQLISGRLG
jgi:hypothetical protein